MSTPKPNDASSQTPDDIRVLIVDNDEALAQAMAESLERVGYPCTVATSGPGGVEYIQRETFDVIFTDLVMNEVDGMEVLSRAKKSLPDCQVIVVTGHASVPKAVEAMQQGASISWKSPSRLTGFARSLSGRRKRSGYAGRTSN